MSPTIYQLIIHSNTSCSKVCALDSVAKRTEANKRNIGIHYKHWRALKDIIVFSRTSTARSLVLRNSVFQMLVQLLGGCYVDVRLLFAVTHCRPCSEHLTHRIPVPQLRHWTTRNNARTAGQRPTIILHPYRRWCHRVVTDMSLGAMTTVRNKRGWGGHHSGGLS